MEDKPVSQESSMVVLDLGSRRKKQIKRLRKGKGKLMKRLEVMIADLREQGTITPSTAVVVIVKQKRRKKGLFNLL